MKQLLSALLLLGASACSQPAKGPAADQAQPAAPVASTSICVDSGKINTDAMCTMQYDPVCGCNGKTYGNACTATNAGVTSYTRGECPTTPSTKP